MTDLSGFGTFSEADFVVIWGEVILLCRESLSPAKQQVESRIEALGVRVALILPEGENGEIAPYSLKAEH